MPTPVRPMTNQLITTQPLEVAVDNYCRHCGRRLIPKDNFCGECGNDCRTMIEIVNPIAVDSLAPSTELATTSPLTVERVLNNRMAVIGLVAFLGPLGLLALWFSQRFKTRTKVITTAGYVLVTTVLPIAIIWYWLDYSMRPLLEVFEITSH